MLVITMLPCKGKRGESLGLNKSRRVADGINQHMWLLAIHLHVAHFRPSIHIWHIMCNRHSETPVHKQQCRHTTCFLAYHFGNDITNHRETFNEVRK